MRPARTLRSLALGALALGIAVPAASAQATLTGFLSQPTDQVAVPGMPGSAELDSRGQPLHGPG